MKLKPTSSRVIVYGGTFDPPHQGHAHCIVSALQAIQDAHLYLMLTPSPVVVPGEAKKVSVGEKHRLKMTELFVENLPDSMRDRVEIRTDEFKLPRPNYSVNTLEHLNKIYPEQKWSLLIGMDQWESFAKWQSTTSILSLASVIVCGRPTENGSQGFIKGLHLLESEHGLKLKQSSACEWTLPSGEQTVQLLDNKELDISSSRFRERWRESTEYRQLTYPNILDYINSNKLYGDA